MGEEATPEMREIAAKLGEGLEVKGKILKISVPCDEVPARVTQELAALPTQDLTIEDVGIEVAIRDLFAGGAQHQAQEAAKNAALG